MEKFFGSNPPSPQTEQRMVGKIIKLSDKGYGFISSRNLEFTRIFFHWTALRQNTKSFLDLTVGMQVEFTPIQLPEKGWRATKIEVIETEDS